MKNTFALLDFRFSVQNLFYRSNTIAIISETIKNNKNMKIKLVSVNTAISPKCFKNK